jgi:ERCC4-related helicase
MYAQSRIFFATPICFFKDLKSGSVDASRAVLMIFDEAHNDMVSQIYPAIIKLLNQKRVPIRVLALSATPSDSVEGL